MTKLGPGWVCQPVVGVQPLHVAGSHVFCCTYRSESPFVLSFSCQELGSLTFESISPNVALASVVPTKPFAGVASTLPAYAESATATTTRPQAHLDFTCPPLRTRRPRRFESVRARRVAQQSQRRQPRAHRRRRSRSRPPECGSTGR